MTKLVYKLRHLHQVSERAYLVYLYALVYPCATMPKVLVVGASRGLGLALAKELQTRTSTTVVTTVRSTTPLESIDTLTDVDIASDTSIRSCSASSRPKARHHHYQRCHRRTRCPPRLLSLRSRILPRHQRHRPAPRCLRLPSRSAPRKREKDHLHILLRRVFQNCRVPYTDGALRGVFSKQGGVEHVGGAICR